MRQPNVQLTIIRNSRSLKRGNTQKWTNVEIIAVVRKDYGDIASSTEYPI